MRINPGGRLDTREVVGRDREIARYWHVLERQGLVISAERRIGKTHIVLKMRDECRSGFLPFYQDLESVHSTTELIRSIYSTVHHALSTLPGLRAKFAKWTSLLPDKIGGVELPAGAGTWQALLSQAFEDLASIADDRLILLLWDEFPLMLHNLQRREGDDAAIRLLNLLRSTRLSRAGRLRFLFTGSIGLHLVLRSLRKTGSTNDPVNDMLALTVPPMARDDTCYLAAALLEETCSDPVRIPDLASRVADEVGGFPYYIHHVVDQLDQLRRQPTLEDVKSAVDSLVYDSQDPANLNYYVTRLSSYYTEEERSQALIVLDSMAGQALPITSADLMNLCKHRDPSLKDEQLREILTMLVEDHYIEPTKCAGGAAYNFRWKLVGKWWKERRS